MKDEIIAAGIAHYGPPENPNKRIYLPDYGEGLELEIAQSLLEVFKIEALTEPNYDRCYRFDLSTKSHSFELLVSLVHPYVHLYGGRTRFGIQRIYTGNETKLDKVEKFLIGKIKEHGLTLVPVGVLLEQTPFKFSDWFEEDGDFLVYHLLFDTASSTWSVIEWLKEMAVEEGLSPIQRYLRQWNRRRLRRAYIRNL
jgi:hypothetical protein